METRRHTLEALGLAGVPLDDPLSYPGAWPDRSGLLDGDALLPLEGSVHPGREPVLAVGSNACPGQLRRKLSEAGLVARVPMVRVRTTGLGVGVSAHVSRAGYVAAAPFRAPDEVRELFVLWLDAEQLAAVDAGEGAARPDGNYRRAWLPEPVVRVCPADGRTLPGVHAYVGRRGVLRDSRGLPREHPGERALLTALLREHRSLRELFGGTPEEFVARARSDAALRERGARAFARERLVTPSGLEPFVRPVVPRVVPPVASPLAPSPVHPPPRPGPGAGRDGGPGPGPHPGGGPGRPGSPGHPGAPGRPG